MRMTGITRAKAFIGEICCLVLAFIVAACCPALASPGHSTNIGWNPSQKESSDNPIFSDVASAKQKEGDSESLFSGPQRTRLNQVADWYLRSVNNKDIDADAEFRWAVAEFNPDAFKCLLEDFYKKNGWKTKIKKPEDYIKKHIYDVTDKMNPRENAKSIQLPDFCLVATEAVIQEKIVELWKSRKQAGFEAGWALASRYRVKVSDGLYARHLVGKEGRQDYSVYVLAVEDIPPGTFADPPASWSRCLLEEGEGVVKTIPLDEDIDEFYDKRYVDAMVELCQHMGASSLTFRGEYEANKSESLEADSDASIESGIFKFDGNLSYKENSGQHARTLVEETRSFSPGVDKAIFRGRDHYSSTLKKILEREDIRGCGLLRAIEMQRLNASNQLTGKVGLKYRREADEWDRASTKFKAGLSLFKIPIFSTMNASLDRQRKTDREKTWVWEVEFPPCPVSD